MKFLKSTKDSAPFSSLFDLLSNLLLKYSEIIFIKVFASAVPDEMFVKRNMKVLDNYLMFGNSKRSQLAETLECRREILFFHDMQQFVCNDIPILYLM